MLLFPIWSHATKHGDVEEVNNIRSATWKETDIIKPALAENAIEHGDVEEIGIIQPTTKKEIDIIKPAVAENATKHGDVEEVDNIHPTAGKETDIIKPIVQKMPIQTWWFTLGDQGYQCKSKTQSLLHTTSHQP